jgi:hypothetical protein
MLDIVLAFTRPLARPDTVRAARNTAMWIHTAAGIVGLLLVPIVNAAPDPECTRTAKNHDCGIHNMMLVGEKSVFLSHLPMFHHEHRFQAIFEAEFERGGKTLSSIYANDRVQHPKMKMYTVAPADRFVLSRVFVFGDQSPQRTSFRGTVFRGHLERNGERINGLHDVEVKIKRVIYARELGAADSKLDKLSYVLFGKGEDLFLAHQLSQAPDFDQILAVAVSKHSFTPAELASGVTVTIPGRNNAASERMKEGEETAAEAQVNGTHQSLALRVRARRELYFEEGELLKQPSFEATEEEKKAGF